MNPIQSILVHIDAGPHGEPRLRLARALAGRVGAGVTGLYAVTSIYVEMAGEMALGGPSQALLEIDDARLAAARHLVAEVNATPGVQVQWRQAVNSPEYALIHHAYYTDLLVLGQHDPDHRESGVSSEFVPSAVLGSGKPALVVPHGGTPTPSVDTVLLAWKETREAAHALAAALPMLHLASTVHVALDADTPETSRDLLLRYLQRHGVEASCHALASARADAGDLLLSMAADVGADLLVMGCYGHTRTRELVLGGATRTVLRSMTLPVLMAH